MSIVVTLLIALKALGRNKMRTALTMLGMIIGVAAVISLMAIGRGSQNTITERIESLGSDLLFVRPTSTGGSIFGGGGDSDDIAGVITFLLSDDAAYMEGSTVVVDGATIA